MEYLVIAVILYFILQTTGNLVYILRGGAEQAEPQTPPPTHNWEGPSPRQEMEGIPDRPTFWGQDIDDATWRDVED